MFCALNTWSLFSTSWGLTWKPSPDDRVSGQWLTTRNNVQGEELAWPDLPGFQSIQEFLEYSPGWPGPNHVTQVAFPPGRHEHNPSLHILAQVRLLSQMFNAGAWNRLSPETTWFDPELCRQYFHLQARQNLPGRVRCYRRKESVSPVVILEERALCICQLCKFRPCAHSL